MVKYLLFKYLRFDKEQPFIMLCKVLAFLGVCIGVGVLIVAMALMNGFSKEFEKKLFVLNYPITIVPMYSSTISKQEYKSLETKLKDYEISPYIFTQTAGKNDGRLAGMMLFGIDFEKELKINTILKQALEENGTTKMGTFDIVVGAGIADELGLYGDKKLQIIFPQEVAAGFGSSMQTKRFNLKGVFKSGLNGYDRVYAYTSVEALEKITQKDGYTAIHLNSKNPQEDIININKDISPRFKAIGWWERNGNLFSALELEKKSLFLVLMLIIVIASLNIISSLLMIVMNRRSEIALLLAMGASKKEVKNAFFTLGSFIGLMGVFFGALLGLLGIFVLGEFDIVTLPADVYGYSKLPLDLSLKDFVFIIVGASIIVLLSSFYPSLKASKIKVLEVLRNE